MPYSATVFRVMIASPSDVEQERRIAKEVVYYWNSLHSLTTQIVLEPISWETHSSPEMGDRPQAIINKQVLKNADLLIGIFWARLGTPTGAAESGTVEEIQEHIKAGKPAMIYFSKQPVVLESVDQDQYQKLKTFIDECKTKGLLSEYDSLSQFKEDFYCHLVRTIDDNEYFKKNLDLGSSDEIQIANMIANHEQNSTAIELTDEAKQLLIEASKSSDGRILKLGTSAGLSVQTNGKNFVVDRRNPRIEAMWENALNQLVGNNLIEDRGYKGEVFAVTSKGFEFADYLITQIEKK